MAQLQTGDNTGTQQGAPLLAISGRQTGSIPVHFTSGGQAYSLTPVTQHHTSSYNLPTPPGVAIPQQQQMMYQSAIPPTSRVASAASADLSPLLHENSQQAVQSPFHRVEYDVTDILHLLCTCGYKKILILDQEEVVYNVQTCCSSEERRLPYGELGNVDVTTCCFGCRGIKSNITSGAGKDGSETGISPGCFGIGQDILLNRIVGELKTRFRARGDTGIVQRAEMQLQRLDHVVARLQNVEHMLGLLLSHQGIQTTPPQISMPGDSIIANRNPEPNAPTLTHGGEHSQNAAR